MDLLLAGVLLIVAARPASAQAPASVAGHVIARDTGRAVSGADVRVDGTPLSAVTNTVGRFQIDGVVPGTVTLVVRAAGFLELRVAGIEAGLQSARELVVEIQATPNIFETVQVTGSRTPVTIGNLAALANVVDRESIDRRNDQELTQAIKNVPGVVVSGQAGVFESVLMRGMPRDGNEFTTTLLMIDGVPQVDSRNSARVVNLPIFDAASIEIVRGPNSALYGRTAIGGVVNVRTADPTPDTRWAFDYSRGEFTQTRGIVRVSGPINDRAGYYVSAGIDRNEGFYERDPGYEVIQGDFFGKLTFVPDDKSFASLSYGHASSDNSLPTNVPIIDGTLLSDLDPGYDRLSNINIPGTNYHQSENRLTASYVRQLNPRAAVTGVFGYHGYQYEFIDDGDVIGGPFNLEAKTLTMYPFEQLTDEDVVYMEGRAEFTPSFGDLKSTLLAGVSYERTNGTNAGNLIYTDPETGGWPLNYLTPVIPNRSTWQRDAFGGRDYTLGVTGLFFQYTAEPTTRWILTAGGRYDRMSIENTATLIEGQPTTEDTFSAFSPKLTALFKLTEAGNPARPAISLYGAYSQAFQPPRRPSDLVPRDFVVDLEPEDISNVEGGVRGAMLNERLLFSAGYFYMTRTGIVATVRQGPFFVPTNSGEHKYKGLEGDVSYHASDRLSVYTNMAFYQNRFGDFVIESAGGNTVLTGNHLPVSPDYVINWGGLYRLRPDLDLTLNVKHVGESQLDIRNTFTLDGYTNVDLAGSWRWRALRVTASARNLFNAEYYWGGDTSLAESADPGQPRQVLVTISALFR
jgi:iron complex outermembrane receptor protein